MKSNREPDDLAALEEAFKHAIGKLPDYKRSEAWEYIKALEAKIERLQNEIDSLANELVARSSNNAP